MNSLTAYKQEQGSALLATILIVGAIGVVLAGIGEVARLHVRSTAMLEDASIAYAAAEAGLEDGLLRWRFNRNVELPILADGREMQENVYEAVRVNLADGALVARRTEIGQGVPKTVAQPMYDLRIWYRASQVGEPTQLTAADYSYRLDKDQALELDASNLGGRVLEFVYALPDSSQRVVTEVTVLQVGLDGSMTELKKIETLETERRVAISIPGDPLSYRVRIKPFILQADGTQALADSYITYAMTLQGGDPRRGGQLLDTGVSYIEATGYYGGTQRKLLAKVDRQSGTVLEVFDYVLSSEGDIRYVPGF